MAQRGDKRITFKLKSHQRIILNTSAQYIRTIINVCLSLYSTRLVLSALGQSDFGIFSVIGGVVALLSFLTNALVTTTQRYLSFHYGQKDKDKIKKIFANSLFIHLFLGAVLLTALLLLAYPVVYHLLNIDIVRQQTAMYVYILSAVMLTMTLIISPFRALYIARENIVYISVVDVIDGILKLVFAILLFHVTADKLVCYSGMLLSIQFFNFFVLSLYAGLKFTECHFPRLREFDMSYIKELSSFLGWTVYASFCIITRNQGLAVLLNIFHGTVVNAAYGISMQVSGAITFVSSSIVNAINPQIMKAEGSGDRERMIYLAEQESKYSFLLLSLVAIPLIAEMNNILSVWLVSVPQYATAFCRLTLLAILCDQLTVGLTSANQAIGQIKRYTLIFYSFKLLTIIAVWICAIRNISISLYLWAYVVIELIDALLRLPLLKWQAHISIRHFCRQVFLPIALPTIAIALVSWICVTYITIPYRFLLTLTLSTLCGCWTIWFTALSTKEKKLLTDNLWKRTTK